MEAIGNVGDIEVIADDIAKDEPKGDGGEGGEGEMGRSNGKEHEREHEQVHDDAREQELATAEDERQRHEEQQQA